MLNCPDYDSVQVDLAQKAKGHPVMVGLLKSAMLPMQQVLDSKFLFRV